YDFGISHDQETLARGERHAARALELDPSLGLGHLALGYVRYKQGDFLAMLRLAKCAAESDHTIDALFLLGFALGEAGRVSDARRFANEAVASDPLNMMAGFA